MTAAKDKPAAAAIKELLSQSPDGLREILRAVMQELLEAEMTDVLQAAKGERTTFTTLLTGKHRTILPCSEFPKMILGCH